MEGESCPRTGQIQTEPAAGAPAHTAGRAGRGQADLGNCEAGTGERVQDETGSSCKITGNRQETHGSKGIRQWPLNRFISPMIFHKKNLL